MGPKLTALCPLAGGTRHWPPRLVVPSTVSALVNDAVPVPLGPLKGPDWVVPEMLNEPYIALSPNGATVPPTTFPAATLMVVVALVSLMVAHRSGEASERRAERPASVEMEELLDPRQELALRVGRRRGDLGAHALKLALPACEHGSDLLGQAGSGLEKTPHRLVVDDPALHVGRGQAGRVARVAGHERHLAEDVAGTEMGHVTPSVAAQHLDAAAVDDEQRVPGIAFPDDLLALAEERRTHRCREGGAVGLVEAGEHTDARHRLHPGGHVVLVLGRCGLRRHEERARGVGDIENGAVGRVPDAGVYRDTDLAYTAGVTRA